MDGNPSQVFYVLDDANDKEDFAHAKIIFANHYGKAVMRGFRSKLINEFNTILDSNEVLNNLPYDKLISRIKYRLSKWCLKRGYTIFI